MYPVSDPERWYGLWPEEPDPENFFLQWSPIIEGKTAAAPVPGLPPRHSQLNRSAACIQVINASFLYIWHVFGLWISLYFFGIWIRRATFIWIADPDPGGHSFTDPLDPDPQHLKIYLQYNASSLLFPCSVNRYVFKAAKQKITNPLLILKVCDVIFLYSS